MPADADFLAALLADPSDDATRLVYADFLDEQGEGASAAKAEFLRLTVELAPTPVPAVGDKRAERLQQLAAGLDTDWLAVVSRLPIENCQGKKKAAGVPPASGLRFTFRCDRQWNDLRPTAERTMRFCEDCKQTVHYCDTITEARRHAVEGHCIAVDLGVIRRKDDLAPMGIAVGRVSAERVRREMERMEPDPVSAERERQKREAEGIR